MFFRFLSLLDHHCYSSVCVLILCFFVNSLLLFKVPPRVLPSRCDSSSHPKRDTPDSNKGIPINLDTESIVRVLKFLCLPVQVLAYDDLGRFLQQHTSNSVQPSYFIVNNYPSPHPIGVTPLVAAPVAQHWVFAVFNVAFLNIYDELASDYLIAHAVAHLKQINQSFNLSLHFLNFQKDSFSCGYRAIFRAHQFNQSSSTNNLVDMPDSFVSEVTNILQKTSHHFATPRLII